MHCDPEVVEEMEVSKVERMGLYLRLEALESVWRHEDNQDLYVGVAQKLRRDKGIKCERPEDEEENVLFEAKQLALKDAAKRKPGDRQVRAGDTEPTVTHKKSFGK